MTRKKTGAGGAPQDLEFHPLADLFPLLEGAEFDEVVQDVRAHGVREAIWLYEGQILEGRNRYRAAAAAGVACPMRPYEGDDPLGFVVSMNLKRRHLSESQRAWVAAKLATLGRGGDHKQSANLPIAMTQDDAADLFSVSPRTVRHAAVVRHKGVPELQHAVERGEVSASAAAVLTALPSDEQREVVAKGEREMRSAAKEVRTARLTARGVAEAAVVRDAGALSVIAFNSASREEQQRFLSGIGIDALLGAMPTDMLAELHRRFLDQYRQRITSGGPKAKPLTELELALGQLAAEQDAKLR